MDTATVWYVAECFTHHTPQCINGKQVTICLSNIKQVLF